MRQIDADAIAISNSKVLPSYKDQAQSVRRPSANDRESRNVHREADVIAIAIPIDEPIQENDAQVVGMASTRPTQRSNEETAVDIPFATSTAPKRHDIAGLRNRASLNLARRKYIKVISLTVIVVVVVAAISVGVYCGQGKCTSDPNPVPAPAANNNVVVPAPSSISFSAALTEYINNITLSGRNISASGVTPEDEALKFMIANETTTADDLLTNGAVRFRMRQRFALLSLWFQQSINGVFTPSWTYSLNWGSVHECAGWSGISCGLVDVGDGAGMQNAVSAIELIRGEVSGSIPADIGLLTSLLSVDLTSNSIQGTVPESISKCTDLMTINLGANDFLGSLPSSIGNLITLTQIDLSGNQFGGTLPETIGQWTTMQHFNVYGNVFGGTIPTSINNWRALSTANFQANGFTGTIPSQVCNNTGNPSVVGSPIKVDCPQVQCDCCENCF